MSSLLTDEQIVSAFKAAGVTFHWFKKPISGELVWYTSGSQPVDALCLGVRAILAAAPAGEGTALSWREALHLIATTDPVDAALDPQRLVGLARQALAHEEQNAAVPAVPGPPANLPTGPISETFTPEQLVSWLEKKYLHGGELTYQAAAQYIKHVAAAPPADAGKPEQMPTLPQSLVDLIGDYGLARTDGISDVERLHRWKLLIDGIKQYAASVAAPPVAGMGEPVAPLGWLYDWLHSSALGKPDELFTGFTTDEAYARKHDNPRAVCAIHCRCPACCRMPHASDCAVHNEPASPIGSCDCAAGEVIQLAGLAAVTADAERLCWALRPLVRMVPAGAGECWVRFKVGSQEFTIGNQPLADDEAAHFAGLFVLALACAVCTLPLSAGATPPASIEPAWWAGALNRRATVEQWMFDAARGKRPMPTAEELRAWAIKLGTPEAGEPGASGAAIAAGVAPWPPASADKTKGCA